MNDSNRTVSVPCELLEQALDAAAAIGMQDVADELDRILTPTTTKSAELTDALPTVAVEGDQLVIRITTECLLHAVTCAPEWPVDYTGEPISVQKRPTIDTGNHPRIAARGRARHESDAPHARPSRPGRYQQWQRGSEL
ncbi:hypothetical protein LD001_04460 [Pseudomonas kurunegalensis]|uniref:hypothetical protein n=1 Tax=Pseudomonas kurunegalensis TaxID=485880 RepID=UPI001CDBD585|nr:hypothetical protein [Pseudomonas kurunegalensis]MCA4074584.1 hypothetical protein [Pseudomonas kurunegalensis]